MGILLKMAVLLKDLTLAADNSPTNSAIKLPPLSALSCGRPQYPVAAAAVYQAHGGGWWQ
jgi:hypothetical protein